MAKIFHKQVSVAGKDGNNGRIRMSISKTTLSSLSMDTLKVNPTPIHANTVVLYYDVNGRTVEYSNYGQSKRNITARGWETLIEEAFEGLFRKLKRLSKYTKNMPIDFTEWRKLYKGARKETIDAVVAYRP